MQIHSLAISARLILDMHSLNNEGTEGNQQQTRMVHILDQEGQRQVVNAISGDMFKHILVEHLTPLLQEVGQPLSPGAKRLHPDRILLDSAFQQFCKANTQGNSAILGYMLEHCAVTDMAGTLLAEKAVARKSCVEFGWVVGLPDRTVTEQYFHVKYDAESRASGTGQGSMEGKQAIFHRPASSGIYALVCNLDLYRVGLNDITREYSISSEDRQKRSRALIAALMASLIKISGAQRNTQNPHLLGIEGIVSVSPCALPAPAVSPLTYDYRDQVESIAQTLSRLGSAKITTQRFSDVGEGVRLLTDLAQDVEPV